MVNLQSRCFYALFFYITVLTDFTYRRSYIYGETTVYMQTNCLTGKIVSLSAKIVTIIIITRDKVEMVRYNSLLVVLYIFLANVIVLYIGSSILPYLAKKGLCRQKKRVFQSMFAVKVIHIMSYKRTGVPFAILLYIQKNLFRQLLHNYKYKKVIKYSISTQQ